MLTTSIHDVVRKNQLSELQPHWHDFPVEIVQKIVQFAATSSSTAFVLCLVSKSVFLWTVPVLYHTIIIRDQDDLRAFEAASNARALRPSYGNITRNLYLPPGMSFSIFTAFLTLKQLSFSPFIPGEHPRIPPLPSLTHLTLYNPSDCVMLNVSSFRSITHLFIASKDTMILHIPRFLNQTGIPNLTHFVAYICTLPSPWADHSLRIFLIWLNDFPKLRVAGLVPMMFDVVHGFQPDTGIDLRTLLRRLNYEGNPKLVLIALDFDASVWESWCQGKENVWEFAERLLSEQPYPV